MTNVPDIIREAISEAYKLFDSSYRMNGTDDEWVAYWNQAGALIKKYEPIPLFELFYGYSEIIETAVNNRKEKADGGHGGLHGQQCSVTADRSETSG